MSNYRVALGGYELDGATHTRRLRGFTYNSDTATLTSSWSANLDPGGTASGATTAVFRIKKFNNAGLYLVSTDEDVFCYTLSGSLNASWGTGGSPSFNAGAPADVSGIALDENDTAWISFKTGGNWKMEKFTSLGAYDSVVANHNAPNHLAFSERGQLLRARDNTSGVAVDIAHVVNEGTGADSSSQLTQGGAGQVFPIGLAFDGTSGYLTEAFTFSGTQYFYAVNMSTGASSNVKISDLAYHAQMEDTLILHSNGYIYCCSHDASDTYVRKISTGAVIQDSLSLGFIPKKIFEDPDGNLWIVGGTSLVITDSDFTATTTFDLSSYFDVVYAVDVGEPYGHLRGLDLRYTKKMVAIGGTGNGEIWYGTAPSVMASLSDASGDVSGIDTSKPMQAFSGYEKVLIANNSIRRICDFANTKINLAASLAHVPPIGTVLSTSGGATMLVDFVPSGETFFYARALTAGIASGDNVVNAAYSINQLMSTPDAAPHIYDWAATASTASASFGTMPNYCAIGCLYRGRAVLAGDKQYPWTWYMSRQGNVFDWAYTANDAQSPVAAANADAGKIGDNITCTASYKDDYLILGCVNSVWVLRGDPAAGGSLDEVTLTTGVYGPYSYCWDGKDNFYFLGTNGIWRIGPNFGPPELLTKDRIPNFAENLLDGLNPDEHRVILHYDRQREGILVLCTKLSTGENDNYWFDLRTFGWFPEGYEDNGGAYSTLHYEADNPTHRGTYLGCTDGYIREFSDTTKSDDLGAIDSYVTIGPVQLAAQRDLRGRLTELSITTAVDTDAMNYSLYVGDTPESVIDDMTSSPPSTPLHSGSLSTDGRPQTLRPRTRGAYFGIRCYNSVADQTFVLENIIGHVKPAGGL